MYLFMRVGQAWQIQSGATGDFSFRRRNSLFQRSRSLRRWIRAILDSRAGIVEARERAVVF